MPGWIHLKIMLNKAVAVSFCRRHVASSDRGSVCHCMACNYLHVPRMQPPLAKLASRLQQRQLPLGILLTGSYTHYLLCLAEIHVSSLAGWRPWQWTVIL